MKASTSQSSTSLKFSIGCCIFREEIVNAVRTQREKFELTVPAKPKARECADLLLLSIYVFIPPSRGLEIRTLEIVGEEESLEARKDTARNLLIQMANGDIRLHFSNFKTRKFVGRDELALGVSLVVINLTRRLLWFFAHCSVFDLPSFFFVVVCMC